ncbi:hypothetical protein HDV63DRAFT_381752 [Trichoderma sp. SZMC 28014]
MALPQSKLMAPANPCPDPHIGSLDIKDFTSKDQHAGLAKRKREQESDTDDGEDIPSRIVKKQSSDNSPADKTAATTTRAVAPKQTTSYLTTRRSRGGDFEKALKQQNALLIKRCDALEVVVADLQRKADASHLNLVVLLTTILEKVTQIAEDVDVMKGEWGF